MTWTITDIPDQSGRVVLITGANSGLGFQTAKALVEKQAKVIMLCRSMQKAQEAKDQILSDEKSLGRIDILNLDLSDLNNISRVAKFIKNKHRSLDILINNAGIMAPPRTLSRQGLEIQFAVNHLAHMALTLDLLPLLERKKASRVVTLTSGAQYIAKINWSDLNGEYIYDRWASYSQSKLANVMFSLELDRRLTKSKIKISSIAAHPGLAKTNLQSTSLSASGSMYEALTYKLMSPFFQSAIQGSFPQLFAATDPSAKSGKHYGPRFNFRGSPRVCGVAKSALDNVAREKLWNLSMKYISRYINIEHINF